MLVRPLLLVQGLCSIGVECFLPISLPAGSRSLCSSQRNNESFHLHHKTATCLIQENSRRYCCTPGGSRRASFRGVLHATSQQAPDEKLRLNNQKAHENLWATRRGLARAMLSIARAMKTARQTVASSPTDSEGSENQLVEDGKGALVISAVAVAVAAATIRVGGRAALVSALGFDISNDDTTKDSVESFLAVLDGFGPAKYAYFFSGWVVAKTFCIDFISIVLALSSGVVFGGVLQGALLSTTCATLASVVGFQLARTRLTKSVSKQLEKRPALRALERVVSEEGLKTVITLRLAPVLPIPLGAYNYAYGATSLPLPTFLVGTFLGSLKPYLLDSYLGVFGKSLVDGQGGPGGDLALVGTFFVVALVGTFASQVAGRTWEELNAEARASTMASSDSAPVGDIRNDGLAWLDLWGIERSALPGWLRSWQERDQAAKDKIRAVVEEEWEYMEIREAALAAERAYLRDQDEALLPEDPQLPPPGPPVLDKDGRGFDMSAYIRESTAFPFVLNELFWKYSNPKVESEILTDTKNMAAAEVKER